MRLVQVALLSYRLNVLHVQIQMPSYPIVPYANHSTSKTQPNNVKRVINSVMNALVPALKNVLLVRTQTPISLIVVCALKISS
jgi:hypothetical protein